MAFGTAAGYGNLPEDITNTDYTGEIENFGDTVNIIKEPTITVSSYTRGSVVNTQNLADDQITLTVDQANAFAFKIDDIEERHSHVNFEALATSSGAFSLKRKYDANVLQTLSDGAGIAGADDASLSGGLTTTNSALGTASAPINVETDDAGINLMLLMARVLDDQSVPEENRWFVAPPIFYEKMFQAGNKIAEVQVTGDASSNLRNGLATPGTLAGFSCYKSTALNSTAGTDQVTLSGVATDASENIIMAGHISAAATASHIAKTEVVRSTESFSDVVRGLHVFGRKVLRPEALVRGIIDFA
jgi:hypothetical protein